MQSEGKLFLNFICTSNVLACCRERVGFRDWTTPRHIKELEKKT